MSKTETAWWQYLLFCCEWIAAIAGIIAWKHVKNTRYKYFVGYLLFIAVGDIVAYNIAHNASSLAKRMLANELLYDLFIIPIEFLFFYWFYYRCFTKPIHKKYCMAFAVCSIIFRVLESTVWSNENFSFSSLSYLVSSVFLIALVLLYLVQFMRSDNIIHYHRHFDFWVTLGLLVYFLGTFPLFAFYNYLNHENKPFFYNYWRVQMSLNMLMYLFFSFAFIWTVIKHRYLFYSSP
jgi:hypothetical protein